MTTRECSKPECSARHEARGLCKNHYEKAVRSGDIVPRQGRETLEEKFWNRVAKSGGCWTWIGASSKAGYGRMTHKINGAHCTLYAHRISYEIHQGPIPHGHVIDHLCRNRGCVNPGHLEAVTNEENIARGQWAPIVLPSRTECIHGHEYTEENTYYAKSGHRKCRECTRITQRAAYARRKAA